MKVTINARQAAAITILLLSSAKAQSEGVFDIEYVPKASGYESAFGVGYYQIKDDGFGFYGNIQSTLTKREPMYDTLSVSSFGDPVTERYKDLAMGNIGITKKVTPSFVVYAGVGYRLIFYKDQLLKIKAIGKDINADSSGSEGKKQFKELEDALIEKYEESKRLHSSGNKLYQERDEFYQCLAYDGCGSWFSFWEKPDRSVVLELHGSGRGSGYIDITYEASPEWSQALEIIKSDEKLKTKQGL